MGVSSALDRRADRLPAFFRPSMQQDSITRSEAQSGPAIAVVYARQLRDWLAAEGLHLAILIPAAFLITGAPLLLRKPMFRAETSFVRAGAKITESINHFSGRVSVLGLGPTSPEYYSAVIHSRGLLSALLATRIDTGSSGSSVSVRTLVTRKLTDPDSLLRARLRSRLFLDIDRNSGMSVLAVQWESPRIAASIADSVMSLLSSVEGQRSGEMYSEAARERGRIALAADSTLDSLQAGLAGFREANRSANAPDLALRQTRLEHEIAIASRNDTRDRLAFEQARINAAASRVIFTILDHPVAPTRPVSQHLAIGWLFSASGLIGLELLALIAWRSGATRQHSSATLGSGDGR